MQLGPSAEEIQLAKQKNTAAMRLLARGKPREALDNLNDAIRIAPSYPQSYLDRAHVFERLGMALQAEADRRRAQELARTTGHAVEGPGGDVPSPGPVADARSREQGGSPRQPPSTTMRHLLPLRTVRTVAALVAVAGIVTGIVFGSGILGDGDSGGGGSASPSRTGTATPTPTTIASPTLAATATPSLVTAGSPLSFADMQTGWKAKNMVVTLGDRSAGFSGFATTPIDVSLVRGNDSMQLSVLVYKDYEAVKLDWELVPGKAPVLRAGRSLPTYKSVWWNQNTVVVARSQSGDIGVDALNAFFALSP